MLLESRNFKGQLAMFCALAHDSVFTVEYLLTKENLRMLRDDDGNTLMHWTAAKGSVRMYKLVLDNLLMDPLTLVNDMEATVFHLATGSAISPLDKIDLLNGLTSESDANFLKTLEAFRVRFSSKDNDGSSALHFAARNPKISVEIVNYLIQRGVYIKEPDIHSRTPLSYLVANSTLTLEQLDKFVSVLEPNFSCTILYAACSSDVSTLKILGNRGAFFNSTDSQGNSILHYSVKNQRYSKEILEYLVSRKTFHKDRRNFFGETPLLHAVKAGSILAVKTLIDNGVEINAQNKKRDTYRITLGVNRRVFFLANLKEAKHHAVRQNSGEAIQLLLQHGASVHAEDIHGHSSLFKAVDWGSIDTLEEFCRKDRDGHLTAIEMLSQYGAENNDEDAFKLTPLRRAVGSQRTEIVSLLLENGADYITRGHTGQSLIHKAIETRNVEIVRLLLDHAPELKNFKVKQTPYLSG
ncbi:hypothetical protein NHQ30_000594 [Ciborinia camelliae]|nr:hypothetical protein NHQ30_000594 [Ciborinia camelliae]